MHTRNTTLRGNWSNWYLVGCKVVVEKENSTSLVARDNDWTKRKSTGSTLVALIGRNVRHVSAYKVVRDNDWTTFSSS